MTVKYIKIYCIYKDCKNTIRNLKKMVKSLKYQKMQELQSHFQNPKITLEATLDSGGYSPI